MKVLIAILFTLLFRALPAEEHACSFPLGGGLTADVVSDAPITFTPSQEASFFAHLPGYREALADDPQEHFVFRHTYSEDGSIKLTQHPGGLSLQSGWKGMNHPDFIHLLYAAARVKWLNKGIFPVHGALVGNDKDGYALLIGPSGAGKTSLALNAALKHHAKVFSGDKTLVKISEDGKLYAIAGTKTFTVRGKDIGRWEMLPKLHEEMVGSRLSFQLKPESYPQERLVPVTKILLVNINDGCEAITKLSPDSALHTLYPFFIDKEREDVILEEGGAFFDGAIDPAVKSSLSKKLKSALETIPAYQVTASLDKTTKFIFSNPQKKILFGICGIGNGHATRQLPVVEHFLNQGHKILIFTYGEGIPFFKNRFKDRPQLKIVEVSDPYFVGEIDGLDFDKTGKAKQNGSVDFNRINCKAMDAAHKEFNRPDLVISDYEMVAADYAYAKGAPLITFDQQSKYLVGDFQPLLNGTSYQDEVERLSLFFPKADKRIAVSFFKVNKKAGLDFDVEVLSPTIRTAVLKAKGWPLSDTPALLVYVTAQQQDLHSIDTWIEKIRYALPDKFQAHFFLPRDTVLPENESKLSFYHHGDKRFDSLLFGCHGIITTAGHNLLSEAMYLEKPVFALPLPLYEQQLNAEVMELGGFGMSRQTLTLEDLKTFFANLDHYRKNIQEDTTYLIKEPGNDLVIERIEEVLNR